jgi:hypothetical protein
VTAMGSGVAPAMHENGASRLRLAWFGAVAFVAIFGIGEFTSWVVESVRGPSWWAIDLDLVLDAGRRLVAGEPLYADPRFLYPPLAAVFAVPLLRFDAFAVSLAYVAAKLALAAGGVLLLTRHWSLGGGVLAFLALVLSLPFLHDVFLGNANVVLVAAMALAAFGPPGRTSGIALGVAAAIFAKPLVVPFLLWLLVRRRSVFWGTVAAGGAATAIGMIVAGLPAYRAWIDALVAGGRYAAPFAGNHGVTALVPGAWPLVAAVTAVGLVFVLLRRRPGVSLVWAVTSGILLAPYAGTYAALPVAVAMPVLGVASPWFALVILAVSPIATTHPLPVYAVVILLGALVLGERLQTAPGPTEPAQVPRE